jgi:hypothetical protein
MALGDAFQVLEQEIVDALAFAALIYFDPSYGFFA